MVGKMAAQMVVAKAVWLVDCSDGKTAEYLV